jgi:hypothetical protein
MGLTKKQLVLPPSAGLKEVGVMGVRMTKKKDTVRVQMELPQPSIERLKFLKDKTEAASYAEVSKNAYKLYEMILTLQEAGNTIVLREPSGNMKELEIFI